MFKKISDNHSRWLPFVLLAFGAAFAMTTACSESARAKANIVEKDAPKAGVLAKINGEEITEDMLIGDGRDRMQFINLLNQEYDLKMDRINDLIVEKVIGAEAKKANMPLQEYIDKKVLKGNAFKTTEAEFKKFLTARGYPESRITPEIKEEIFKGLAMQKKQQAIQEYAFKQTKSTPVEVYFKKPAYKLAIDIGKSPTYGNAKSAVTIVEFSDFQCPYCGRAAQTLTELKKKYGSKVQFAFKHFPLQGHPQARPAAEASMCVFDQGADKFWKFHDIIFKNQEKLEITNIEKYAKDSGADMKKYAECFSGGKFKEFVQADVDYALKLGVNSTPSFFINGKPVQGGARSVEEFSELIDKELKG
ncbi:thioredoxin domain-containing protein [bacterium]|nr:thioredoxin domain-containing protein [bacterium]